MVKGVVRIKTGRRTRGGKRFGAEVFQETERKVTNYDPYDDVLDHLCADDHRLHQRQDQHGNLYALCDDPADGDRLYKTQ